MDKAELEKTLPAAAEALELMRQRLGAEFVDAAIAEAFAGKGSAIGMELIEGDNIYRAWGPGVEQGLTRNAATGLLTKLWRHAGKDYTFEALTRRRDGTYKVRLTQLVTG